MIESTVKQGARADDYRGFEAIRRRIPRRLDSTDVAAPLHSAALQQRTVNTYYDNCGWLKLAMGEGERQSIHRLPEEVKSAFHVEPAGLVENEFSGVRRV